MVVAVAYCSWTMMLAYEFRAKKRALTVEELADVIGVAIRTIHKDLEEDHIPFLRVRSSIWFDPYQVADCLEGKMIPTVSGPFLEMTIAAGREFFESKFWGPYRVARYAAPHIAKDGSITFFSGAASQRGTPGLAVGSAINAAIEALGRTLAVELAPIRVNTVSPGLIATPVWNTIMSEAQRDEFFKQAGAKLPIKRIGQPEEIAHAVRYLIENTYTTGTVLFPDGGYLQV